MYLNGKNVLDHRAAKIIWEYIEKNEKNMKRGLFLNRKVFQYVYSKCYLDIYSSVEKRGIDLRG